MIMPATSRVATYGVPRNDATQVRADGVQAVLGNLVLLSDDEVRWVALQRGAMHRSATI
jgi:hypothetical protein